MEDQAEAREEWLEERYCSEQDVLVNKRGEYVLVTDLADEFAKRPRKEYLPEELQAGYEEPDEIIKTDDLLI